MRTRLGRLIVRSPAPGLNSPARIGYRCAVGAAPDFGAHLASAEPGERRRTCEQSAIGLPVAERSALRRRRIHRIRLHTRARQPLLRNNWAGSGVACWAPCQPVSERRLQVNSHDRARGCLLRACVVCPTDGARQTRHQFLHKFLHNWPTYRPTQRAVAGADSPTARALRGLITTYGDATISGCDPSTSTRPK